MLRTKWIALSLTLALGLFLAQKSFAAPGCGSCAASKTVAGAPNCAGCQGVTAKCALMLVDKDGKRWVLTGDSDSFKAAFKARHSKKTMTATLASTPESKKDKDGKEYMEAKASEIKISES